jgi:hypothetical protein
VIEPKVFGSREFIPAHYFLSKTGDKDEQQYLLERAKENSNYRMFQHLAHCIIKEYHPVEEFRKDIDRHGLELRLDLVVMSKKEFEIFLQEYKEQIVKECKDALSRTSTKDI